MVHNEMAYRVYMTDDGWFDVRDEAGNRPVALRSQGPWVTKEQAELAVRKMTAQESAE